MTVKQKTPVFDKKKVEEFLLANPITCAVLFGYLALLSMSVSATQERPAWLKDCPPVNGRRAGAWRGKGSFGHGFGPQVKHR